MKYKGKAKYKKIKTNVTAYKRGVYRRKKR